jgi:hypothetical protein
MLCDAGAIVNVEEPFKLTAHMQHAYLHVYTKSHTLLHWIVFAVGVYVYVYDLLLAIQN